MVGDGVPPPPPTARSRPCRAMPGADALLRLGPTSASRGASAASRSTIHLCGPAPNLTALCRFGAGPRASAQAPRRPFRARLRRSKEPLAPCRATHVERRLQNWDRAAPAARSGACPPANGHMTLAGGPGLREGSIFSRIPRSSKARLRARSLVLNPSRYRRASLLTGRSRATN